MNTKMRVLALNNYDMQYTLKEWSEDGQSGHLLWGVTQMDNHGFDASVLPYKKISLLKKLGSLTKIFGDLDQEVRVLQNLKGYDVIYSGHYFTTSLLAFLRKFNLLRKPVVAIAFQSPRKSLWAAIYTYLFISGNDKIICLSDGIKDHFEKDFGLPSGKLEMFEWGFDTDFHQMKPIQTSGNFKDGYVLTTGKSFRDYRTLVEAFSTLDCSLEIIGYSDNILDSLWNLPRNVNITIPTSVASSKDSDPSLDGKKLPANVRTVTKLLKLSEILERYDRTFAVAIPLALPPSKPHNTVGLSSLLEAMCMGRAVIATENRDMGVDLEREGIGLTVPHGDAQAWRQAVQYLVDYPEETLEMGNRARYLAEKRYNLEGFTNKVVHCMRTLK